jgi:histidinol phosphatase-like PHP family hydrolase
MVTGNHDLHIHSIYSDANSTIFEIAERAHKLGLETIAITDHFWPSLGSRRGGRELIESRRREIVDVRSHFPSLTILDGAEVDVAADGTLAEVAGGLIQFDIIIGSFHWSMDSSHWAQALSRSLENPKFQILGHWDGFLTYFREEDGQAAARALAKAGVAIELSGRYQVQYPRFLEQARDCGCTFSFGSDAHSVEGIGRLQHQRQLASDMSLRIVDLDELCSNPP